MRDTHRGRVLAGFQGTERETLFRGTAGLAVMTRIPGNEAFGGFMLKAILKKILLMIFIFAATNAYPGVSRSIVSLFAGYNLPVQKQYFFISDNFSYGGLSFLFRSCAYYPPVGIGVMMGYMPIMDIDVKLMSMKNKTSTSPVYAIFQFNRSSFYCVAGGGVNLLFDYAASAGGSDTSITTAWGACLDIGFNLTEDKAGFELGLLANTIFPANKPVITNFLIHAGFSFIVKNNGR